MGHPNHEDSRMAAARDGPTLQARACSTMDRTTTAGLGSMACPPLLNLVADLLLLLLLLLLLVVVVVVHQRTLLLPVVHVRGCPRHRPCFLGTHPLESERLVPPYPAPILLVAVSKDQSRNNMQPLVVAPVARVCPSRRAMEILHRAGAIGSAIMLLQGFRLGYYM